MAAARVWAPSLMTSSADTEDYSIYSNMSEEQLLQLAIERSLADENAQQICSRTPRLTALCSGFPQSERVPTPANPPANPPATSPANPADNPPLILSDRSIFKTHCLCDGMSWLWTERRLGQPAGNT